MSITAFLLAYVLGGVTFLPLVCALLYLHAYYTFPNVSPVGPATLRVPSDEDGIFREDDEKLVRRIANSIDVAEGYFIVTRDWVPGGLNGKPPERPSPSGSVAPTSNETTPVYLSMYRSLFDRRTNAGSAANREADRGRGRRVKNEFYVVLRHGHLMLYDDDEQTEVRHVISLSLYRVSIYGGGAPVPEGELYVRRNAICLARPKGAADPLLDQTLAKMPFFFFSENCSQKEDFYLALLKHQERSQDDPSFPPRPLRYRQKDIISLVHRLHSSEDHLQMNWVNGLLGRLFLSVYKTRDVEQFVSAKIAKKISRVNKPNFLSEVTLRHLSVGEGIPYITNPRLKEMTADGDFCAEMDIDYVGNFRMELSATATMNLGARFKPREVNLVLAVVLKRLDGHGLLRIKPPPSNRMWFAFESMPKMELSIEPIVGSRQIAWGPVLRMIEGRIRDTLAETVVHPNYDDIPFTDTVDQKVRGGIWADVERRSESKAASNDSLEKEITLEAGNNPYVQNTAEVEHSIVQAPKEQLSGYQQPDQAMSSPSLRSASGKKPASAIGIVDVTDAMSARSPSIKSSGSGHSKDHKTPSYPISASEPLVEMNVINAHAMRMLGDDGGQATSAVMAIRSRSSSGDNSSPLLASNSIPRSQNPQSDTQYMITDDFDNLQIFDGTETEDESGSSAVQFNSADSVNSFSSANSVSTSQKNRTVNGRSIDENPSMIALGTAAATVKKWYAKSRKGNTNSTALPRNTDLPLQRNLPPADCPLPQFSAKKSDSSKFSKRKSLPPPVLPVRRKVPPIPPREREDELLIVAAPDTFESDASVPCNGAEIEAGDLSDVSSETTTKSTRASSGSWERRRMLERAKEENEIWHAAEEAELRTRVPWEADDLNP